MFGDNGVLTQADNAASSTAIADLKEVVGRTISGAQGNYFTAWNKGEDNTESFFTWLKANAKAQLEGKESGYTISITDPATETTKIEGTIQKGTSGKLTGPVIKFEITQQDTSELGITVVYKDSKDVTV